RDAVLLTAEVHVPEHPLVTASAMPHGDTAHVVAAARADLRLEQALLRLRLRDLVVGDVREIAARGRRRLDGADRHGLRPLHEVDLVARSQRDDRLLPVGTTADVTAHALQLPFERRGADVRHLDVEDLLDRRADLDLVGVRMHAEGHRVVLFLLLHALLGHEGPDDDLASAPAHRASASSSARSAARSNTTWRTCISW